MFRPHLYMIIDVCGLADQYKKQRRHKTYCVSFWYLASHLFREEGGGSTTKNLTHLFWFSPYLDF